MKTRKHYQIIAKILSVICMSAVLVSCTDSKEQVNSVQPSSNIESSSEASHDIKETREMPVIVTDKQGLIMTTLSNNENGAYEIHLSDNETGYIVYYDFASQQKVFLTSQPAAPLDENNTAYVEFTSGGIMPVVAGDSLYIFKCGSYIATTAADGGTNAIPYIQKMDFNGANKEKMTLTATTWLSLSSAIAYSDELLYVIYNDYNIERPEESTVNVGVLDFNNKELRSLYEYPAETNVVIADTYEEGLVLRETRRNDDEISAEISLFSLDTKVPEVKFKWDASQGTSMPINNNALVYYIENNALKSHDLVSGEVRTVAEHATPEGINVDGVGLYNYIYDNHILGSAQDINGEEFKFAVELDTGSSKLLSLTFTELTGEDNFVSIFGETDDYFIVHNNTNKYIEDSFDPGGNPIRSDRYVFVYSLISKEDYWNSVPNYIEFNDTIWE